MGVAAVGYALGRPQNAVTARPPSNKRKAVIRSNTEDMTSNSVARPDYSLPPNSSPILGTRLQKRSPLRRPQSSIFPRSSIRPPSSPHIGAEENVAESMDWKRSSLLQDDQGQAFKSEGGRTTRSSWLRRLSSFSTYSQNGSPTSTSRPQSSSISFSSGSMAPILSTATSTTLVTPRNKLVKRASSQRLLHNTDPQTSTLSRSHIPPLRRPATSYQRSELVREREKEESPDLLQDPFQTAAEEEDTDLSGNSSDPLQDWRPFFRSRTTRLTKEGPIHKRNSAGHSSLQESLRSISPVPYDVPTLLVATAIKDMTLEDTVYHNVASPNRNSPMAFGSVQPTSFVPLSTEKKDLDTEMEQNPRSSFSISDLFPSPLPSTWKFARSGSIRRKKGSFDSPSGRRVVSAPQSYENRNLLVSTHKSRSSPLSTGHFELWKKDSNLPGNTNGKPPSPLPQMNRLSAFEIDLPGEAPSYPVSPQSDAEQTSPRQRNPFSASLSSPSGPISPRAKTHRPYRVPSDRASTLIGSENSRVFSGEREEVEYQSETAYDSVRTGATGSSHSGIRGPKIETIFDESPPRELRKNDLAALQDLLSNGSFADSAANENFIEEERGNLHTPIGLRRSFDENAVTPIGEYTRALTSPSLPSSPPAAALARQRSRNNGFNTQNTELDEDLLLHDIPEPRENHNSGSINQCPIPSLGSPDSEKFGTSIHDISMSRQSSVHEEGARSNLFEWSERHMESQQGSSPRPNTVHGKHGAETRGSRISGRRGPSALHLRSQSVPVPQDPSAHRSYNSASKLDTWLLGNKGASEEWDGDFEFDEQPRSSEKPTSNNQDTRFEEPTGMLVPRAILERQASVHGQFGQVKELTLLVEELKRLRYQASVQGIMRGQSAELWKEAEGIINLATLDDEEQEFLPPRSPHSPSFDHDPFEEDSPASQRRRRSGFSPSQDDVAARSDVGLGNQASSNSSPDLPKVGIISASRPRKESVAKAKSVLENISQHRIAMESPLLESKATTKKLPFDTTSLRDLVTRAGVVTRALKEIVRRAENSPTPEHRAGTPPDPPFSQIFQNPSHPPSLRKSPQGPQTASNTTFSGGSVSSNDNDINGHMKMMAVV